MSPQLLETTVRITLQVDKVEIQKKSRTFVIKIPAQRPCESKNSMKSRKFCYQDSLPAAMRVKKSNEKVVHLSLKFLPSGPAGQKIQ